jgi:hypothetical protein
MCDMETLEPCNDEDCEGLYEIGLNHEDDDERCSTCNKVDCICDMLTDTYRERDLF